MVIWLKFQKSMIRAEDDLIDASKLSAKLDSDVLTLYYAHHLDARVDWTFTY